LVANVGAEAETSIVGLAVVAWMAMATVWHLRVHPGGAGRGLLIAGWVLLGVLVVYAAVSSIGSAAFEDGVVDGLLSLAAAPPTLVLVVPLALVSWAILRDGKSERVRRSGLVTPS
jgi:hypothetical protein